VLVIDPAGPASLKDVTQLLRLADAPSERLELVTTQVSHHVTIRDTIAACEVSASIPMPM
jgi:hypothetical protein